MPLRVGICITESKRKKLQLPAAISKSCKEMNIELIDINLEEAMEGTGPYDVILHKILEFRNEDFEKGEEYFEKFAAYIKKHSEIRLIDPISTCAKLVDRSVTMACVKKCEFTSKTVGKSMFVPNFCYVDDSCKTVTELKELIAKNNMCFPIIMKHFMGACIGREAHDMSLIFGENGLSDIKTPCFLQQFHNHNGYMLKIYTVGEKYYLCKRPSIRDLKPGNLPSVHFNSGNISKRGKTSPLHIDFSEHGTDAVIVNDDPSLIEEDVVVELLKRLKGEMEFNLLGIDIIVDKNSGNYGIIDVNYFPGYDGARNKFHTDLVELLVMVGSHRELEMT